MTWLVERTADVIKKYLKGSDGVTGSRIVGSGSALPEQIVTNHDLAARVDTSDEWIIERTGIRQRHLAGEGETTSTLAIAAARAALALGSERPISERLRLFTARGGASLFEATRAPPPEWASRPPAWGSSSLTHLSASTY